MGMKCVYSILNLKNKDNSVIDDQTKVVVNRTCHSIMSGQSTVSRKDLMFKLPALFFS